MTSLLSVPPREVLALLWCGPCGHRLCPESMSAETRAYQCSTGCRPRPVNGAWLEAQIAQAIGGTVPLDRVGVVIERITVGQQGPGGVKVLWRRHFPPKPQPDASGQPPTVFVAAQRAA